MNIFITGVGGQGTILASKLLAKDAIARGEMVRTAETIGMAQRGGSVVSHVRIGADCHSPAVPKGKCDLILGFEPAEAVRNLDYLAPDGHVVASKNGIIPVTASIGAAPYAVEEICAYLEATGRATLIDGEALCAEVGSPKVLNVLLLAVAAAKGYLPFTQEELNALIAAQVKPQFIELNKRAVAVGFAQVEGTAQ